MMDIRTQESNDGSALVYLVFGRAQAEGDEPLLQIHGKQLSDCSAFRLYE